MQIHTQEKCHVKMKAEIAVVLLQAKELQMLPANHQELAQRRGTDSPSQRSGGTNLPTP